MEANLAWFNHFNKNRSPQVYTPGKLDERTVRFLLRSAISSSRFKKAPDLAFVIVQNTEVLRSVENELRVKLHAEKKYSDYTEGDFNIFSGGKTLILICSKSDEKESVQASLWFGQNLMFAANALGLASGTVLHAESLLNSEKLVRSFEIPHRYHPVLPIVLGFPILERERPHYHPVEIISWAK